MLAVLQQGGGRARDLRERACMLAGALLELAAAPDPGKASCWPK